MAVETLHWCWALEIIFITCPVVVEGTQLFAAGVASIGYSQQPKCLSSVMICCARSQKEQCTGKMNRKMEWASGGAVNKYHRPSFHPSIRNSFFAVRAINHWNNLLRDVSKSPSMEVFKVWQDTVPGNFIQASLSTKGSLLTWLWFWKWLP